MTDINDYEESKGMKKIRERQAVQMVRFIDCYVPINACNLRCPYCYITQSKKWDAPLPQVKYSTETIVSALSKKRLGGICHFNICGNGETLMCPQLVDIVKGLLGEGHFVFLVTNGTLSNVYDKMMTKYSQNERSRLGFKFSFHYLQLKERNMVDIFFENVKKVRDSGCSFMVDITPYDELVPYIDEIKQLCMKKLGAYCHVLVARKNNTSNKTILTKYSRKQYKAIWSSFDSELFEYKLSIFGKKRKEFCYAGDWSFVLNLLTGEYVPCYSQKVTQNIYEDINKPIRFCAIGEGCKEPHCFNGHAFLTLGVIPALKTPFYSSMKNKRCEDETEWLTPIMKKHLNTKLYRVHKEYSLLKKMCIKYLYSKL